VGLNLILVEVGQLEDNESKITEVVIQCKPHINYISNSIEGEVEIRLCILLHLSA